MFLVISLCGLFARLQSPNANGQALRRISACRQAFESLVVAEKKYELMEHIYSHQLDQNVRGFYPLGASDRRYLLYVNDVDRPTALLFQQVTGGHAKTSWRVDLHRASKVPRYTGTLSQMLRHMGVEVRGKVSDAERASLQAKLPLAAYQKWGRYWRPVYRLGSECRRLGHIAPIL